MKDTRPYLIIGIDPMPAKTTERVVEALKEHVPDFQIVVVAGLTYATVVEHPAAIVKPPSTV